MDNDPVRFDPFDLSHPHLRTCVGGEEVLLTRVTRRSNGDPVALVAGAEDAFALVFQLRSLPAHSLRFDGKSMPIVAGPAHSLALVDLAGEVSASVEYPIDSMHLRISRAALDDFAEQSGRRRISRLYQPGAPFSDVDGIVAGISTPLLGAVNVDGRSSLMTDHLMLALMAHLMDRYGGGVSPTIRPSGGLAPWQERRAKAMLDVGGAQPAGLAEVALACGVSVGHFSRAFRNSVGKSPWAWRQEHTIERAQALMRDATLSLTQIANDLGFSDQSHFSRTFSALVGTPPRDWRRDRGIF